ncbi:MAG: hypothetical protein ACREFJ_01625 [Acetobacteraceae bacterium]
MAVSRVDRHGGGSPGPGSRVVEGRLFHFCPAGVVFARAAGAVNTVLLRDEGRIGPNTDETGFAESFRGGFPEVPRRRVGQIGAGGDLGRAIALFTGRRADAERMRRHFETLRGDAGGGDAGARREERAQARSTSSIL